MNRGPARLVQRAMYVHTARRIPLATLRIMHSATGRRSIRDGVYVGGGSAATLWFRDRRKYVRVAWYKTIHGFEPPETKVWRQSR